MLEEMTWPQFSRWLAYSSVEPFGEERADLRAGVIASTIANVNRDSKRRPRPYEPSDFIYKFGSDAKVRTARGERRPLTDANAWSAIKMTARSYARSGALLGEAN